MHSERVIAIGRLERVINYRDAIAEVGAGVTRIDAVALEHLHAGPEYRVTVVVDDVVVDALPQFLATAPAHNAIYLTAIDAFREAMPGLPIFFFQAEDGIRDADVTGVQTCALPISLTESLFNGTQDGHGTHAKEQEGGDHPFYKILAGAGETLAEFLAGLLKVAVELQEGTGDGSGQNSEDHDQQPLAFDEHGHAHANGK